MRPFAPVQALCADDRKEVVTEMFPLDVVQFALAPLARLRDRMVGNVKVHFSVCRMVGQRSQPVVRLQDAWVENTTGQHTFVSDFEVRLIEPVSLSTTETQWRERRRPVEIAKGANVPPHGKTDEVYVLIHLDGPLPAPKGFFRGEVTAVGQEGFRRRPTVIEGDYEIADK